MSAPFALSGDGPRQMDAQVVEGPEARRDVDALTPIGIRISTKKHDHRDRRHGGVERVAQRSVGGGWTRRISGGACAAIRASSFRSTGRSVHRSKAKQLGKLPSAQLPRERRPKNVEVSTNTLGEERSRRGRRASSNICVLNQDADIGLERRRPPLRRGTMGQAKRIREMLATRPGAAHRSSSRTALYSSHQSMGGKVAAHESRKRPVPAMVTALHRWIASSGASGNKLHLPHRVIASRRTNAASRSTERCRAERTARDNVAYSTDSRRCGHGGSGCFNQSNNVELALPFMQDYESCVSSHPARQTSRTFSDGRARHRGRVDRIARTCSAKWRQGKKRIDGRCVPPCPNSIFPTGRVANVDGSRRNYTETVRRVHNGAQSSKTGFKEIARPHQQRLHRLLSRFCLRRFCDRPPSRTNSFDYREAELARRTPCSRNRSRSCRPQAGLPGSSQAFNQLALPSPGDPAEAVNNLTIAMPALFRSAILSYAITARRTGRR